MLFKILTLFMCSFPLIAAEMECSKTQIKDVPKDIEENKTEAYKFYKIAADQGDTVAQFRCAVMLHYAQGIPENKPLAFQYYKLAANNGHLNALLAYGIMLYYGEGVLKDKEEAYRCLKSVADREHPDFKHNMLVAFVN